MLFSIILYNNLSLSILEQYCRGSKVLLIESYSTYSTHHKKKLAFFISAMRHFYEEHKTSFDMEYIKTDQSPIQIVSELKANKIRVFEPADYDLWSGFSKIQGVEIIEDPSFICTKKEFAQLKPKVMEAFYRKMRRKTGLLLVSSANVADYSESESSDQQNFEPVGGKWNFDSSNRKKMPDTIIPPEYPRFPKDRITLESIELVNKKFSNNFGEVEPFYFATTRSEALQLLKHFVEKALPKFGVYQDAMKVGENFLFHSILAPYLNIGLLSPMEVCTAAEEAFWRSHSEEQSNEAKSEEKEQVDESYKKFVTQTAEMRRKENKFIKTITAIEEIPIESVEGFIRQIIGWREYIRGVYWLQMPKYKELNSLKAEQKLPDFYWTAKTELNCLRECISQTKQMAYSHHIQRLMVTGNFAMLIGANPSEIHEWYLKVYADAHEWVELPNTIGMAVYADGGIVGTKPYPCSGNYINKMSDFCKKCKYNNKKRTGPDACPFNYLYWNFLMQHDFSKNPRMFAAYAGLSKLNEEEKAKIRQEGKEFIAKICKNED